ILDQGYGNARPEQKVRETLDHRRSQGGEVSDYRGQLVRSSDQGEQQDGDDEEMTESNSAAPRSCLERARTGLGHRTYLQFARDPLRWERLLPLFGNSAISSLGS